MNCGLKATIIEYISSINITVKFETGEIRRNVTYSHFKDGKIGVIKKRAIIKNRLGEQRINNQGLNMKIIKTIDAHNITVEFDDGYTKDTSYSNFKNGKVKNPFFKSFYGVGYIGETETQKDNKDLESFKKWKMMLDRCYNLKHKNYNSYGGCGVTVCEEWHYYKNFKDWFDKYYYEIDGENIQLDKDILVKNNKIYSPDTCVFVPQYINNLFKSSKENGLPVGVNLSKNKKRYIASIRVNKKTIYLGRYDTSEEAFLVYKEAKEKEIKRVADEYKDKIPEKLYEAMYDYKVEITD